MSLHISGIDGYCPPEGQKIHLFPRGEDGRSLNGLTLCGLSMDWTARQRRLHGRHVIAAYWHEPDVSHPATCRRCKSRRADR